MRSAKDATQAIACEKRALTMSVPGGQAEIGVTVTTRQLAGAVNNRGIARRHPLWRAWPATNVPADTTFLTAFYHIVAALGQLRQLTPG